jgi:hypothetical protein
MPGATVFTATTPTKTAISTGTASATGNDDALAERVAALAHIGCSTSEDAISPTATAATTVIAAAAVCAFAANKDR